MAVAKKGLGRGLAALIPDDIEFLSRIARGEEMLEPLVPPVEPATRARKPLTAPLAAPAEPPPPGRTMTELPPVATAGADFSSSGTEAAPPAAPRVVEWVALDDIEANPFQPRRTFNEAEMQELVDSVRDHGILQPILVRPLANGTPARYQLVAGERRWRAAKAAGLERVPAVVREVADQQALELALIENVQRHDISAVDAAIAYQRLATEFHLSQEEIARRVGKSRSAIANTLRLLDLPAEAQTAIDNGELTEGHGRAILLAGTEGARRAVFREILRGRLSVRDAEHLARRSTGAAELTPQAGRKPAILGADLAHAEADLQKALGTRVKLRPRGRKDKSGQIIIEYFSDDDLTRILGLLHGKQAGERAGAATVSRET